MTIELPRRGFILGLGSLMVAPAIVRASSLMPVKVYSTPLFTLADYERIMKPMLDKLSQQITDNIMNGNPYILNYSGGLLGVKKVSLNDLHPRH